MTLSIRSIPRAGVVALSAAAAFTTIAAPAGAASPASITTLAVIDGHSTSSNPAGLARAADSRLAEFNSDVADLQKILGELRKGGDFTRKVDQLTFKGDKAGVESALNGLGLANHVQVTEIDTDARIHIKWGWFEIDISW
jgi:hypothetical protein